jgi:hypothetical protein
VFAANLAAAPFSTQPLVHHGGNQTIVDYCTVAWTSLLGDSPIENSLKPKSVITRFIWSLRNDFFGVLRSYADLSSALISSIKRDSSGSGVIIDTFLLAFKSTPIFREYHEYYKSHDSALLRYILSFLNFGKKVAYVNRELDDTAFREWQSVEEKLATLVLPSATHNLSVVLDWLFWDFEASDFLPKHGSGSVAERGVWGTEGKNQKFQLDPKLMSLVAESDQDLTHPLPDGDTPLPQEGQIACSARLTFVPKNWKTSRIICMIPLVFMWAQQAVRLWYEDFMAKSIMGNHVRLKDQRFNQRASREGSLKGKLDTIDLKSASDSVLYQLIQESYPPHVFRYLEATRSRSVLTPVGEQQTAKFAPMGSALCFPVQSSLYTAIILMVSIATLYRRDWREPGALDDIDLDYAYVACYSRGNSLHHQAYRTFYVYGDDLVVDNAITSNVIEALELFGFTVNVEKTFVGESAYRESCGKHYVLGEDISPLIYKTKFFNQRLDTEAIASLIDKANQAYDYGYLHLRRHLVQQVLYSKMANAKPWHLAAARGVNPILFTNDRDTTFALYHPDPRNDHLPKRSYRYDLKVPDLPVHTDMSRYPKRTVLKDATHLLYQRSEVASIGIGPLERVELSRKYDNYRHIQWWRSQYGRTEDSHDPVATAEADTKGVRIVRRWTAA